MPLLEVENRPASSTCSNTCSKDQLDTAMAGFLSRLPRLACQPGIKARHPLRAFFFWAIESSGANFNSWRAMICFPLRLKSIRKKNPAPAADPAKPSRSPRGCARAIWTNSPGNRTFSRPGQLLRRAIEADRIQSLIFYGPPGTGKTSLAQIIARQTKSKFERLSGVESNVADMRRVLSGAANRLENTGQPRFCSLTKSIASTKRSRTCCCRMSKAAWSSSSARRRTIRFSSSTRRWSRARRFLNCAR